MGPVWCPGGGTRSMGLELAMLTLRSRSTSHADFNVFHCFSHRSLAVSWTLHWRLEFGLRRP